MGLKLFGVGGIDQKSNNLLRDPMDLVDGRNIMASIDNDYIKRPGTEEDTQFTDDDYNDMIFIKSLNQYFHRFNNEYVTYENGVRKQVYKFADPLMIPGDSNISLAEYLNTAIFTHEENQNFTAKYDGESIYRAGLPVPEFTNVASGTAMAGFMINFFDYIDAAGNEFYGPAKITPITNEINTITINTFKDTGFYGGFLILNTYSGIVSGVNEYLVGNGTTPQRTITYTSKSDDLVVGSKIIVRNTFYTDIVTGTPVVILDKDKAPNLFYLELEIESLDTTTKTIVFTSASFKGYSVQMTDNQAIHSRVILRSFFSTNETTGYSVYRQYEPQTIDNTTLTNTGSRFVIQFSTVGKSLLSDIYDITTSKLRPPKCKYLYTYGYQLVCAPAISFYDFENKETLYTNNDLVMYSDVSTGDLGENFSEGNRQLIGNTYDGFLTGLARVKDSIIATKNRSIWALDGILIPGQYALRKIETNQIGCLSAKSLLEIDSAVMFQGQDGIYATDGYKAEKVSEKLDPFFRTINPLLTRSVMNNDFDQYLFWTDQAIVVFDYHYKKIYLWDSIDASKGITVDNELSIRFFSALKSTKFQTDLNDSGTAINAYIRSAWHDLGEPGLLKKATFLRLYAFKNVLQKISLKYFLDWDETKFKGPFEFDMDTVTVKRNLDVIQNQSFSFEFRNNVIDQDLNISGYEINAGIIQERDKNVK